MNRGRQQLSPPFSFGIDQLVHDKRDQLKSRRFGLLMNRASVDSHLRQSCSVLDEQFPGQLVSILTPQHGIWGEQQANMVETGHGFHQQLRVPIYSLYSETRRPTEEMLDGLDCLVVDLQDVGTRVYTFIWTLLYCLQECASRGIAVVVLDRPNPVGGETVEGHLADLSFRSFVCESRIPMRHGLTIGELARFFTHAHGIDVDLTVVPMSGWQRGLWFEQLQRIWIPPSPNMPTVQTACVYPGQVLLEGTNLSEGRGTTVPFEVTGAPFIDPQVFSEDLNSRRIPGVRFLPLRFTPAFDKWAGQSCGGVSIHVTDRQQFRSLRMTCELLESCQLLYGGDFRFLEPPYEYEFHLKPIDIISGSSQLRARIESTVERRQDWAEWLSVDDLEWARQSRPWQKYP